MGDGDVGGAGVSIDCVKLFSQQNVSFSLVREQHLDSHLRVFGPVDRIHALVKRSDAGATSDQDELGDSLERIRLEEFEGCIASVGHATNRALHLNLVTYLFRQEVLAHDSTFGELFSLRVALDNKVD